MSTIIVSNSGSDAANGSLATPVATLGQALKLARAGDTIVLRGGEYAGGVTVEQANITITNYPGEHAIVSAGTSAGSPDWVIRFGSDAHGGTLNGLEVVGGEDYAVKLESTWDWGGGYAQDGVHDITIQNCSLHDSGRDVIKVTPGCDGVRILHNEIYNSGMRDGSNAEGIDVVNADRVVIRGNYIHDTATTGAYIKGGCEDGLIEGNYIKNTGTGGAGGVDPDDPPNSGAGLMLGYTVDEEFFSADNPGYVQTTNAVVRNNIIQNTGDGGILVWGSQDAQIYNNTLYNVSTKPWYFGGGIGVSQIATWTDHGDVFTKSSNISIHNNIVVVAGPSAQSPGYVTTAAISISQGGVTGGVAVDNNLYHTLGNQGGKLFDVGNGEIALAQWQAKFGGVDSHSLVGNPQLDANLHLTAGSPAVNAGATIAGLTTDFDGQALGGGPLDIGADQADSGPLLPLPAGGAIGDGPAAPQIPPGGTGAGGATGGGGNNGGGSGGGGNPPTPPNAPAPGLPFTPLAKPVAGVDGVYSGPDAQHVALNGHIALHLVTPAFSDYTGGRLRIVEEPSGKVVGEIDFVKGDAYDGKQTVDIDLAPFGLKADTTYSVVTTNDFLRVNAAPWQAGAIQRGEWQFHTDGAAPAPGGGDTGHPPEPPPPPRPPPPPPPPPTDEPMVFSKLAEAVAGVDGVWSGADSHNVGLDDHIALKLVTKAYGDYTAGRLRIVEEPSGKIVGEIDFKKGDAYDGKQVVDIDLGQFDLKADTTYSVVTTNDFLRVNAAPWQAGAIARGQWQFTTESGHAAGAPVEEALAFPGEPMPDDAPSTVLWPQDQAVNLGADAPPPAAAPFDGHMVGAALHADFIL